MFINITKVIPLHSHWNRVGSGHRVTGSIATGSGRVSGQFFWPGSSSATVHTSEQDVWCWWPWLTGTDLR